MISVSLIERALESRDYDRLLRDLADNGVLLPLSVRLRLSGSESAALAMGLRRLVELTYLPTPQVRQLIARLLQRQQDSGEFAADGESGLFTTILAVAALETVLAQQPRLDADHHLTEVRDRGYAYLASQQDGDGLFTAPGDRSIADRATTTAFMVSQLGRHEAFCGAVHLADLHRWFEEREGRLDRATAQLWSLASLTLDQNVHLAAVAA